MKNGICVLVFCNILCFAGCRSSSNSLDTSVRIDTDEKKTEVKEENISLEKSELATSSSTIRTDIGEESILVTFDPESGNIQSVQTTRRRTGRTELGMGMRQRSDVSGINRKDSTDTHSTTNIETDEHRESKGDSRTVQGIEWIYVFVGAAGALILIISAIIYFVRKRKK